MNHDICDISDKQCVLTDKTINLAELIQNENIFLIFDPDSFYYKTYKDELEKEGYQVKILSFQPKDEIQYNPLYHIQSYEDIDNLCKNIISCVKNSEAYKTITLTHKLSPVFCKEIDDSMYVLLQTVISMLCCDWCRFEDRNLYSVKELICRANYEDTFFEQVETTLDILMDNFKKTHPDSNCLLFYDQYNCFSIPARIYARDFLKTVLPDAQTDTSLSVSDKVFNPIEFFEPKTAAFYTINNETKEYDFLLFTLFCDQFLKGQNPVVNGVKIIKPVMDSAGGESDEAD